MAPEFFPSGTELLVLPVHDRRFVLAAAGVAVALVLPMRAGTSVVAASRRPRRRSGRCVAPLVVDYPHAVPGSCDGGAVGTLRCLPGVPACTAGEGGILQAGRHRCGRGFYVCWSANAACALPDEVSLFAPNVLDRSTKRGYRRLA